MMVALFQQHSPRAHQHLFSVYVPSYAEYKGLETNKDIPHDGWVGYRKWRMEEGWKLIGVDKSTGKRSGTNKMRRPPKDSTINREVTMIQEWFKYLLVPEGLVQVAPVIQKAKAPKADNNANPPFDYKRLHQDISQV